MAVFLARPESPTVPALAATWGYNRRTFNDDLSGTHSIDLNDTRQQGFKWYRYQGWPNANLGTNEVDEAIFHNAVKTPRGNIDVGNGSLTLRHSTNNNLGDGLQTACFAGGSNYVGQVFGNGAYFETRVKYDPALANAGSIDVAFWCIGIDMVTGAQTNYVEIDFVDVFPHGSNNVETFMGAHDWQFGTDPAGNVLSAGASASITEDTDWHKYGCLWVPAANNGGTGLLKFYYDDVQKGSDISWTTGQTANGQFGILDSRPVYLILQAGRNWPGEFDYVSVWQA